MLFDCDIHILTLPERRHWLQRAIDSAAGQANVHVVPGIDGQMGAARAAGYQTGSATYVAALDDDDWLEPDAVSPLIDALEKTPDAVGAYGDEIQRDKTGKKIGYGLSYRQVGWSPVTQLCTGFAPQSLAVMRRAYVERYLAQLSDWHLSADIILKGLITNHGRWIHVPGAKYNWTLHDGSKTRQFDPAARGRERARALRVIAPALMQHIETAKERAGLLRR